MRYRSINCIANLLFFMCLSLVSAVGAQTADLIIFSFDRPLQLYALLESIEQYVTDLGSTMIIYRVSNDEYERAYQELQQRFAGVEFVRQSSNPQADFKANVVACVRRAPSDYILFAVDDIIVKEPVALAPCIDALERTNAYGFFLRLGKHVTYCYACNAEQGVPQLNEVTPGIFQWRFQQGSYDWQYPWTVDMTIYRKSDVMRIVQQAEYTNPNYFEFQWSVVDRGALNRTGLCFATSKIINIPMNLVTTGYTNRNMQMSVQELFALFQAGKKIDIAPFANMLNRSAHIELMPTFIARN